MLYYTNVNINIKLLPREFFYRDLVYFARYSRLKFQASKHTRG